MENPQRGRGQGRGRGHRGRGRGRRPRSPKPASASSLATPAPQPAAPAAAGDILFSSLPIHAALKTALEQDMGYATLTHCQAITIQPLLQKRDLHLVSKTGSGKTLAFLVPIVSSLLIQLDDRSHTGKSGAPSILVISPTRELAMQIEKEAKILCQNTRAKTGIVMGGTNMNREKQMLKSGCDLLIATPGRLIDHLESTDAALLNAVGAFVLDECDRLLDMGFSPSIEKIIRHLPPSQARHSVVCSATSSSGTSLTLTHLSYSLSLSHIFPSFPNMSFSPMQQPSTG